MSTHAGFKVIARKAFELYWYMFLTIYSKVHWGFIAHKCMGSVEVLFFNLKIRKLKDIHDVETAFIAKWFRKCC